MEEVLEPKSEPKETAAQNHQLDLVTRYLERASSSAGGTPPPARMLFTLPRLAETVEQVYQNGVASNATLVKLGGDKFARATGYDFLFMSLAARKDSHVLHVNSAFRSNAEQTALWEERQDPATKKRLGPASEPGYSNHQQGKSVDIRVGMTVDDLKHKRYTNVYVWLVQNAHLFGFVNDVASEPWHWTHASDNVVATPAATQKWSVDATVEAIAASDEALVGLPKLLTKSNYDQVQSYARSYTMADTPRSSHMSSNGGGKLTSATRLSTQAADFDRALASTRAPLPVVENPDASVFDFDEGLWGDGLPV